MASIDFTMNGLSVHLEGVGGYIDKLTYSNTDPVDYIYQLKNEANGSIITYRFRSGSNNAELEGFRRTKTDETCGKFLGVIMPGA